MKRIKEVGGWGMRGKAVLGMQSRSPLPPRLWCWLPLPLSHARKIPQAGEPRRINDFPFISSPHSLLSGTALLPLSCRLIEIRVSSLRDGSIINYPYREHLASQPVLAAGPCKVGPPTRPPCSLPTFPRESLSPSPRSRGPTAGLSRQDRTLAFPSCCFEQVLG